MAGSVADGVDVVTLLLLQMEVGLERDAPMISTRGADLHSCDYNHISALPMLPGFVVTLASLACPF